MLQVLVWDLCTVVILRAPHTLLFNAASVAWLIMVKTLKELAGLFAFSYWFHCFLIFLAKPCSLQDVSSLTTDWTQPLAVKALSRRGSIKKCFQNTRLKTFQPLAHLPSDESRLSSVAEVGLPLPSGSFTWRETLWGQNVFMALSCKAPHHFWLLSVFICLLLCLHAVSFCDKRHTPFLLGGGRVTENEVGIQDHQCGTISSQYHLIFVQCLFREEPEQCEGEGLEGPICWEMSSA